MKLLKKKNLESLSSIKWGSGFSFSRSIPLLSLIFIPLSYLAQVDPLFINELPGLLDEASGIECVHPDSCWTHNDNADGARFYLIDENGLFISQRTLSDASQVDYEDICKDSEGNLYIGDFGNNENEREDLVIYKSSPSTASGSLVEAERIEFNLEDQTSFPPPASDRNFDIESMVHHGASLYLFTRNRTNPFNGICKMYRLPDSAGNYEAELMGSFFGNFSEVYSSITSAALSPSGDRLALLTNGSVFLFSGLSNGPDLSISPTYNFFSFSAAFEGISFIDECLTYLVKEADGNGQASLYSLNTCEIISGLGEQSLPIPLQYLNGRLLLPEGLEGNITLLDLSGRRLLHSSGYNELIIPSHIPYGIYLAQYAVIGYSGVLLFSHSR
jgi:hypothetical protein